jgi:N-acetylglucosamine-6-phosphate deacetylase
MDNCLLVSDATSLAGLPPGQYETQVGGKVELHPDGRLSLAGTDYLAGSASSLKTGVENAMRLAGCSLVEAIRLVTVNPARLLSFDQNAITLFGLDAATGRVTIWATCLQGQVVYRNPVTPMGG